MNSILVDTDLMIDFLREKLQATEYLIAYQNNVYISAITTAELFSGVREGMERRRLEASLSYIHTIPVNDKIAALGGIYRRDFGRSHNVGLADAVIAATAEIHNLPLKTFNIKHFPMIKNVSAPYKKD